jgi:hypothetical protein
MITPDNGKKVTKFHFANKAPINMNAKFQTPNNQYIIKKQ